MDTRLSHLLVSGILLLLLIGIVPGEQVFAESRTEYIRSHYTKYEYRIPMRDGVELFTSVYIPNDDSREYPILLQRTPYAVDPYGPDRYPRKIGPYEAFEKEGFIFVFQDVRGKFMSEGEFVNTRPHLEDKDSPTDIDESTDTYDTIEWLLKNVENQNGKAGMWGISYPGFYASAGMIDSHPALKVVSPQAPIADWFFDDMYHHGAFILPLAFNFFSVFGQERDSLTTKWPERFEHGTPDGYQFFMDLGPLKNVNKKYFHGEIDFWNKITEHPNYDEFWQSRNILPHLRNIDAAVMTVGGWFDAEDLYGPLHTYRSIEEKNPGITNVLVMGPWSHGAWVRGEGRKLGKMEFGFSTSDYFQENVMLDFFTHFLKEGEGEPDLPEALVFETGANRWEKFNHWPPESVETERLFLDSAGTISFDVPTDTGAIFDQYQSDPDKPVPYTTTIYNDWVETYMTEDQRFASRRPDVLVYETPVLEQDVTLAGPLQANLYVSTSGSASDWIVKLIDVYPNQLPGAGADDPRGAQQLMVRGEVIRGRFRESYEHPRPFTAGKVTPVSFELQDIFHTFKQGHRIMIHIQSTWFPLVDRNPGKYVPNIFNADAKDFIPVTNRVYRSAEYPSHLEVGILRER